MVLLEVLLSPAQGGAGGHSLLPVRRESCWLQGAPPGALSLVLVLQLPLPSSFWRTAQVGSQLQWVSHPSLQSLTQDTEAQPGPREAAMVAGVLLELPPYPTLPTGLG